MRLSGREFIPGRAGRTAQKRDPHLAVAASRRAARQEGERRGALLADLVQMDGDFAQYACQRMAGVLFILVALVASVVKDSDSLDIRLREGCPAVALVPSS